MSGSELDDLFHDMSAQAPSSESSVELARRRQRAIGAMRALQRNLQSERGGTRRRRFWVGGLAAASVVLGGLAFAASGAWRDSGPPVSQRTLAAPVLAGSVARPGLPPSAKESSVTPALSAALAEPALPSPSGPPRVAPTPAERRSLELETVNQLLADAKRARREHRDAEALTLLNRLLRRFPSSVLAHEASVERFRTLARLGRAEDARRYAAAYLASYPGGFAAEEARRLVAGETP